MRFFVMTAAAATLTTLVLVGEASAVQDTPVTINGVEAVCTGVGSAKDNPAWKDYPVKVVVATSGGADLANAHRCRRAARNWPAWIAMRPGCCSRCPPAATPRPPR